VATVIEGVPPVGGGGGGAAAVKVAPTLLAAFIITLQAPVPLHAPLQPANVEPLAGVAMRDTELPCAKLALQVAPQLMPAGELATDPEPVPASETVSATCAGGGGGGGTAPLLVETLSAPFTVSVHVEAVPLHAPPHPVKGVPSEVAVSVTTVPAAKFAVQFVLQ
jgi:hypothetical protein